MAAEQENQLGLLGKFYRGRVVKLRRGTQSGVIESCSSGRQFVFEWPLVRLLGAEKFDALQVGMEVGFDVSWTSRGLRVSMIRVFPPLEPQGAEEESANPRPDEGPALGTTGTADSPIEKRD
jgi:hypothetical protein